MKRFFPILLLIIINILPNSLNFAKGEKDTITISNGNIIIGEVVWMKENRLLVDVEYGHDDWEIKWNRVIGINTIEMFQVSLSNGSLYHGSLTTLSNADVVIITQDKDSIRCTIQDIVLLRPIESRFIENLTASISFGFDMTKASNFKSISTRSQIGFNTEKSILNLTYDAVRSTQQNTEEIQREEGVLNYSYIFPINFFGYVATSGLSSTEQNLDLRWNLQAGLGNFIVTNQTLYWGVLIGANHNYEQYSDSSESRNFWEGLLGTALKILNLGDLKLNTTALAYPSITERGRWRLDFKFDIKYDFKYFNLVGVTNKIFIKLGFSANYDNRPAEGASDTDYVFSTTLGLSWND